MRSSALIAMAKEPIPGTTKTRLASQLGFEAAAELYECFLLDTLDSIRSIADATAMIAIWPQDSAQYFRRVAPDFFRIPQVGDSLGQRLDHVLTTALEMGQDRAIALSTDSPSLPRAVIADASERLNRSEIDVVIGPADDGGYYLIGVKSPPNRLVVDVEMSNSEVLRNTLAMAGELDLRVELLKPWYDVDESGDLDRLRDDLSAGSAPAARTKTYLDAIEPLL